MKKIPLRLYFMIVMGVLLLVLSLPPTKTAITIRPFPITMRPLTCTLQRGLTAR